MRLLNQMLMIGCTFVIVACGGRREDVWSDYDYLTPVPEDSGIVVQSPTRGVPVYRQTQDNDDTYVIPYEYGICSDGRMGCE